VRLETVRPSGMIDGSVRIHGEYEVRGRLLVGEQRRMGSASGLVVAGTPTTDWLVVGFDDEGELGIWAVRGGNGQSARVRLIETVFLDEPVPPGEAVLLAVRVETDGGLTVRVGDQEPLEAESGIELPPWTHVGVFARDAEVEVEGLVVEVVS